MDDFKLGEFLPYQITVLAGRLSRGFAHVYQERFGLSVAEWRVLANLYDNGGSSVREIHKSADMEKSRVSRAVARLEERGLVARSADAADKRLISLALTEAGTDIVNQIAPLAQEYEAKILAKLDDGETFRDGLQRALQLTRRW